MKYIYLFLIILTMGLTGCDDNFIEKQSEALSQVIYAAGDSLKHGREDLAENYISQAETIVNAPKKRIKIEAIIDPITNIPYVILSDKLKDQKVIIIGSYDFQQLLKDHKIMKQYELDNKNLNQSNKDIIAQNIHNQEIQDKLLKDYNKSQNEVKEYHSSAEYKIKHIWMYGKWLIPIGGAALVVLCIFNPAILPLIFSIGGILFGILIKIFNIGLEIISNIFSLFTTKSSV